MDVNLLTYGAQTAIGTSEPVDVSAHALLRLNVRAVANLGLGPELDIWLETSPATSGAPWRVLDYARYSGNQNHSSPHVWQTNRRVLLGAFDNFCRVRWTARCTRSDGDPQLSLGVVGTSPTPTP